VILQYLRTYALSHTTNRIDVELGQQLYMPESGQVLLDGADLSQVDPAWLRSHIGVVLQENILFNRAIHDNIAFANPALCRPL